MSTVTIPAILRAYPRVEQWLAIGPDGSVRAMTGKVEFGQGIRTALAQIVAHELGVPVDTVTIADVTTAASPDEGVTSGSRSIEEANEGLRLAAATLRVALMHRAAQRHGVMAQEVGVANGAVVLPGGEHVPYASLLDQHLGRLAVDPAAPLLDLYPGSPLGMPVARLDLPAKVFGRPSFLQDMELPGMLHARICRPPAPGATLVSAEVAQVEALPGVRAVVRDGSFLAVVADREEHAIRALRRLRRTAHWNMGTPFPPSARFMLDEPTVDVVVADEGAEPEPGEVGDMMQAEYSRPYLAHAALGPSCAVAVTESGRYRVWTHSQGIFHLRQELAKVLNLDPNLIEVIHREGAGCYGANGADDAALDAVLLARAVPGRPVRVQWMRDDENAWEPYGTAMFVRLRAAIGADGSILHWRHDVWGNGHRDRPGPAGEVDAGARSSESAGSSSTNLLAARHLEAPVEVSTPAPPPSKSSGSGRNANPVYYLPARRVVNHYVARTPLRVSALRSLGAHANVFAIESFMDEIADRIGADPIAYRLRHLSDDRASEVIGRVAAMAGWEGRAAGGDGIGMGVGFARYKNAGAYVAVIAEMEVDRDLHLRRVWAACDAGLVVNPDGLANQLEGGIVQAASWTLKEEVRFTPREITSRDWSSYPILTFAEVPQISVELVARPDMAPCGIGEAVAGPTSAAIANAIFAASGVRLRDMPLSRGRFIEAATR